MARAVAGRLRRRNFGVVLAPPNATDACNATFLCIFEIYLLLSSLTAELDKFEIFVELCHLNNSAF